MADRVIYRRPTTDILSVSGQADNARSEQSVIYEGLVVDTLLRPQKQGDNGYDRTDGYNYGAIKVRIFEVTQTADEGILDEANPLDNTIYAIPLIGELVTLIKIRGAFFYTTRVPIAHRIQENGMLKLNDALNRRSANTLSSAVATGEEQSLDKHKFGEYFRPDSRVRQLMHFEGDTIIQGRMGHSIRFGSSKVDTTSKGLAPNIILRTGQAKDAEKASEKKITIDSIFGAVLEDINKDASSIWMVSDQTVPFGPSSRKTDAFYRSIKNAIHTFDKAQIILNSDRLVLNSKKSHILLYSNNEIYLNSFSRTSIDSDESVYITAQKDFEVKTSENINFIIDKTFSVKAATDVSLLAGEKISLITKKVYLGSSENDVEPVVGGTSLAIFLARLIAVLMGPGAVPPQMAYQGIGGSKPSATPPEATPGVATFSHVITPVGPGQLNPSIQAGLKQLYAELNKTNPGSDKKPDFSGAVFNSYDVFVNLASEDPEPLILKNEFEVGEATETENSTWVLADPYYKVV